MNTTERSTHLLKFVGKMCKYEMDAASIVEDTILIIALWEPITTLHFQLLPFMQLWISMIRLWISIIELWMSITKI